MTDERAKEIADNIRRLESADEPDLASLVLHLYDEVQALKSGLAFLGIGGSIKRGGE